MSNIVLDGIIGLAIGDALDVPVEFTNRLILQKKSVKDMQSFGTYNQPAGTWSDDTSMTLALLDSLKCGINYNDIMDNFSKWLNENKYTANDEVFDVGISTRESIYRYNQGVDPLLCGGVNEIDNGNGSLMRILPLVFYIEANYENNFEDYYKLIHNVSALTHRHIRSKIACGIYVSIALNLLVDINFEAAINNGISSAVRFYRSKDKYKIELEHFKRIQSNDFKHTPIDKIQSSGYVVSTLEASIWCLLNSTDYKSCVLKAVNLGSDTDTTAAVTGGLAGIYYGYDNIPLKWRETLVKREYIEGLCNRLYNNLNKEN